MVRRAIFSLCTLTFVTLTLSCDKKPTPSSSTAGPNTKLRNIEFDVTSGSWMTVDVAPNGKAIIFDLLGNIYEMPIEGGVARMMTSGREWNRAPRYSPDGTQISVVRDGAGPDEIWLMPAIGGKLDQITNHSAKRGGWVGGTPNWSPDGKSIVYGDFDTESSPPLSLVDVANRNITLIESKPPTGSRRSGVFSRDGRFIYFSERNPTGWGGGVSANAGPFNAIIKLDVATKRRTLLTDRRLGHEFTPEISRDGTTFAYIRRDPEGRSALRVRKLDKNGNVVAGTDRDLLALPDEDEPYRWDDTDERPGYGFTPDGAYIVIGAGGKIHKVNIATGAESIIPFTAHVQRDVPPVAQARTRLPDGPMPVLGIQWPQLTADGKTLVFGAVGYIWVKSESDSAPRRLTKAGPETFEFMPALSPDGKSVAYVELAREGYTVKPGRLVVVPIVGDEQKQVVVAEALTPLAPSWSPDGSKLAFIRDNGANSTFAWKSIAGDRRIHVVAPVEAAQRETWGRLVFFAKDGEHLYHSREFDPLGGLPDSSCLKITDLNGGGAKLLVMGGTDTRGIMPSPDGRHALVMGIDDELWLLSLPANGGTVRTDLNNPNLKRITGTGAEYVQWRGDSSFIYSYANKIYSYTIGGGEPQLLQNVNLALPRLQGQGVVAFTNARIITINGAAGAGQVIENGTLVVRDRRIEAVGTTAQVKIPAGAKTIDATGLTLMPAIGDMHYHSQGGTNLLSKMVFGKDELGLRQSVPYGVTFGWQPGGPTRSSGGLALAELQQTGRVPGPRWINAPWAVNMVTYGDNYPSVLATYADAVRSTRHRADLASTVLKEYVTRRRDHRQWLGDAAREVGVGIVSHVQGLDMGLSRAADGYTGFDHPAFPVPVYEDVQKFLAMTGTSWTPNFNIVWGTEGMATEAEREFTREVVHKWPDQVAKWKTLYPARALDTLAPKRPWEKTRVARVAKAAAYLMSGGVKIGISAHNPPALFALGEMWHLQKAGAPRGAILRAGTMNGAEKMGLDREIGSLEKGKIADILVLKANPLDDIINIVAMKYVLMDGVIYDAATGEIYKP
jgi:Tol biopolymer transport system component